MSIRRPDRLLPLVLLGTLGCSGIGGAVNVTIDTDAPVPGGEELGFPPAIFDRVLVETYLSDEDTPCDNCRRIAELDHARLVAGDVSFGLSLPADEDDVRVRVRAFRGRSFSDGIPTRRASVDVVFELPATANGQTRDVVLFLPTDETGAPQTSLNRPRDTEERDDDWVSRVGTWKPAKRTACTGRPWPGQVCAPGGAYWLPYPFASSFGSDGVLAYDEQLVVLSPFFVDATETTVATALRSGLVADDVLQVWSGDEEGPEVGFSDSMTFSGHRDRLDLPLVGANVGWQRNFCLARGADLPSEAQIMALMGGLRSAPFPWGRQATCSDAWLNRSQSYQSVDLGEAVTSRLPCGGPVGTFEAFRPVGTSGRDRLVLDGGVIEDVAGNVTELTRDLYFEDPFPCWGDGWQRDPTCPAGFDPGTTMVARGGNLGTRFDETSSFRAPVPIEVRTLDVGFRCVRPGDDLTPAPLELDLVLGQGCRVAEDCGSSPFAQCITREDTSSPIGGIVGGYCTRGCTTNEVCGAAGACIRGLCLLRCDAQNPAVDTNGYPRPATKCHSRHDLVCSDDFFFGSGTQACFGSCNTDEACGEGRHCDQKLGGCVDTPSSGADNGRPCSEHSDCKGWCVAGVCGDACTGGGEIDSEQCGDPAEGICLMSGLYLSPGSLGYCYPRCSSHDRCSPPNTYCIPGDVEGPQPPWWQLPSHICFPAESCSAEGAPCGTPGLKLTCQNTPNGLRCLDPEIPWTPQ